MKPRTNTSRLPAAVVELDSRFGAHTTLESPKIRGYHWKGLGGSGFIFAHSARSWQACQGQIDRFLSGPLAQRPGEIMISVGSGVSDWTERTDLHRVLASAASDECRWVALADPTRIARDATVIRQFALAAAKSDVDLIIGDHVVAAADIARAFAMGALPAVVELNIRVERMNFARRR